MLEVLENLSYVPVNVKNALRKTRVFTDLRDLDSVNYGLTYKFHWIKWKS